MKVERREGVEDGCVCGAGGAVYPPKSLYLILVETEQHSRAIAISQAKVCARIVTFCPTRCKLHALKKKKRHQHSHSHFFFIYFFLYSTLLSRFKTCPITKPDVTVKCCCV